MPEFNTSTLFFRRIRMGGFSVRAYTAQDAITARENILGRLDALGRRPQADTIILFEEVKMGFARLGHGPMGKVLVQVAD